MPKSLITIGKKLDVLDMTDNSTTARIGVQTKNGLVLIRFYEDGRILLGHTDQKQQCIKPGRGSDLTVEWKDYPHY